MGENAWHGFLQSLQGLHPQSIMHHWSQLYRETLQHLHFWALQLTNQQALLAPSHVPRKRHCQQSPYYTD